MDICVLCVGNYPATSGYSRRFSMKPIAWPPYRRRTLWKKIAGRIAWLALFAIFIAAFSHHMAKQPQAPSKKPKMKTETVITVEKVPYGMCYYDVTQQTNMLICEARKSLTTYRYELLDDGDIILRDNFVASHIVIDGYVDDRGKFYQAPSPTIKVVHPTIKIGPNGFDRN